MKKTAFIFTSTLFFLLLGGCQESTKSNNNQYGNSFCSYPQNYNNPLCTGGGAGNTCQQNPSAYGCPSHPCTISPNSQACVCAMNPTANGCSGTTGTAAGGTTGGGTNPWPNYPSNPINMYPWAPIRPYHDPNWGLHYNYVPADKCSAAVAPTNIEYTPYETRKATVTLKGGRNYDLSVPGNFTDTTSTSLQTLTEAKKFFWADSILKIRFKVNLQPDYRKKSDVCPDRSGNQSSMKAYGKLRFNVYLVGERADGIVETINLGPIDGRVNTCTNAFDLSTHAARFKNGMYIKIKDVQSNNGQWIDTTTDQQQKYIQYGYITPENPYAENSWNPKVRDAECWSLDIEVASDGTKTF